MITKDQLIKIIRDYDISRRVCNCDIVDLEGCDSLCDDCVNGLAEVILNEIRNKNNTK